MSGFGFFTPTLSDYSLHNLYDGCIYNDASILPMMRETVHTMRILNQYEHYLTLFKMKMKRLSTISPFKSTTSTLYMQMINCRLHQSTNHLLSHRTKKKELSIISLRLALTTTSFHSNRKHQRALCLTPYWLLQ